MGSMGVLIWLLTWSAQKTNQRLKEQAKGQTDTSTHTLSAPSSKLSCPNSYSRTATCPEYRRDRNHLKDKCQRYDECRVETIRLIDGSTCSRTVVTYHPTPSDCQ